MKKRETDAEWKSRIDRYFTSRWAMTECAVILEKPMRTITSYVTGQSLSCAPRVWTPKEFSDLEAQSPTSDKLRKRARYGLPNLLQFAAAPRLFAEGVERPMVQWIMDQIAAPGSTLAPGYYLILTGGETQSGYFFPSREAMLEAIASNPIALPQCAIFNFADVLDEVIDRIIAWEDRRPYIPKAKENFQDVVRSEWIAAGATRIPGPLEEAISKAQRGGGQKKH